MKSNIEKTLKASNGITLIALVITIIVLLILAGVTIAMLTGENGILNRATDAKHETDIAQITEELQLAINGLRIDYETEKTGSNLGSFRDYIFDEEKGQAKLKAELGASNLSFDPDNNQITYKGVLFNVAEDGTITKHGETVPTSNNPLVTELRVGDEVIYTDGNENQIPCIVLYDSTGNYGIQIVTKDTMSSPIILGGNTFSDARLSYNTAVATLNNAALGYLNTDFSPANGARSIGSDPSTTPITSENDTGTFVIDDEYLESVGYSAPFDDYYAGYEYFTPYNNTLKKGNGFSNTDYDQMNTNGFSEVPSFHYYWLAARYTGEGTMQIGFSILDVQSGDMGSESFLSVNSPYEWGDETTTAFGTISSYYLRPVFTIKPTIHYEERNNQKYLVLQ